MRRCWLPPLPCTLGARSVRPMTKRAAALLGNQVPVLRGGATPSLLLQRQKHQRSGHHRGWWGGKIFSLFGLLVNLPASPPEPLPTLLRAKIVFKFTRPHITLRLSGGGTYTSFVVTAVSRAKIRGALAVVFNIKPSNVTFKPSDGALLTKRGPVVLCS